MLVTEHEIFSHIPNEDPRRKRAGDLNDHTKAEE
jgi:hypothetical protein